MATIHKNNLTLQQISLQDLLQDDQNMTLTFDNKNIPTQSLTRKSKFNQKLETQDNQKCNEPPQKSQRLLKFSSQIDPFTISSSPLQPQLTAQSQTKLAIFQNTGRKSKFHVDKKFIINKQKTKTLILDQTQHKDSPQTNKYRHSISIDLYTPKTEEISQNNFFQSFQNPQSGKHIKSDLRILFQKIRDDQDVKYNLLKSNHNDEIDALKLAHRNILERTLKECEEARILEVKAVKNKIVRLFMERDVYQRQNNTQELKYIQIQRKQNQNQINLLESLQAEAKVLQYNTLVDMRNSVFDLMNLIDSLIVISDQNQQEQYRLDAITSLNIQDYNTEIIDNWEKLNYIQEKNNTFQQQVHTQKKSLNLQINFVVQRFKNKKRPTIIDNKFYQSQCDQH